MVRCFIPLAIIAIILAALWVGAARAAENGRGEKISAVSMVNTGMQVTQQPSGVRITASISPYVAATSTNVHGIRITVGPRPLIQSVAAARKSAWTAYR